MEFEQPNEVSVWIGTFSSQGDLDRYVEEDTPDDWNGKTPFSKFASDWGFISYDRDFQEVSYKGKALPLRELMANVSYFDSFVTPLCTAFEKENGALPNSYILVFNFAYDPAGSVIKMNSPVRYMGHYKYLRNRV